MRVSHKVSKIASKYLESTYIEKATKFNIMSDLEVMGVKVRPWIDEVTMRDIAIVVSRRILENGVSE